MSQTTQGETDNPWGQDSGGEDHLPQAARGSTPEERRLQQGCCDRAWAQRILIPAPQLGLLVDGRSVAGETDWNGG